MKSNWREANRPKILPNTNGKGMNGLEVLVGYNGTTSPTLALRKDELCFQDSCRWCFAFGFSSRGNLGRAGRSLIMPACTNPLSPC